jgi:WD40 repeat protein
LSFFNSFGQHLITGTFNDDRTIVTYHNWEMTTFGKEREVSSFSVSHPAMIVDGGLNQDATLVGSVSVDGTVHVIDLTTGKEKVTFTPPEPIDSVVDVSIVPSGTRLTTGSLDNILTIWDAGSGNKLITLPAFPDTVSKAILSPDGSQMVVFLYESSSPTLWNLSTGKKMFDLVGHTHPLYNAAFSPDGKRLATVGQDGSAIVWDVQTGKSLLTLAGHSSSVGVVAFSKDGTRLTTGGVDGVVKVWDISAGPSAGQELLNLSGYAKYIWSLDFSPDGRYLASSGFSDQITRVYALQIEDLIAIARSRLTRSFTLDECQKYLHQATCP